MPRAKKTETQVAEETKATKTQAKAKVEPNDEPKAEETKPKKKRASKVKEVAPVTQKDVTELTEEDLAKVYDDKQRKTLVATKKERKQIYKETEDIIPLEGYDLVTPETERQKEFKILMDAAAPGAIKVLEGKIVGYEVTEQDHYVMVQVKLKDSTGQVRIYIPSFELYYYDKMKERTPEGRQVVEQNIKRRVGGNIEFVPIIVDEKNGICYASRLRAMAYRAEKNFFTDEANGKPKYRAGRKAQGIITSVAAKWLTVYFGGAEATIPIEEVTHIHSMNLYSLYKKGQVVTLLIEEVEPVRVELSAGSKKRVTVTLPQVVASIRKAQPDPNELYFDYFKLGGIYTGVISFVVNNNASGDNGNCFVLLDDKIDCHCPRPNNYTPEVGMEVVVKITQKYDESKRINGTIIS